MENQFDELIDCEIIDYSIGEKILPDEGDFIYDSQNGLQINHPLFCKMFLEVNELVHSNGIFYSPDGPVSTGKIRQDIQGTLIDYGWTKRIDTPVNALYNALIDMCHEDCVLAQTDVIPFANGDMYLYKDGWEFHRGEKRQTPYRLSVDYNPNADDMPNFTKWLNDVIADEDHNTLQEMLGYCLVPVTKSQEAFILVGDGGTGKSVLGDVLNAMMGNAIEAINTEALVTGRFQIATTENKLVAYDDDLGSAALTETGMLKKLITADQPIKAERKFAEPYSFIPYCKLIACANFMLSALYDDSDGFFRRLHPIKVLPKATDRKDIRGFNRMCSNEKEAIVRWALVGLKRLINNKWNITWSDRSVKYMSEYKSQRNVCADFYEECFDSGAELNVTSREISNAFKTWCRENGVSNTSMRKLELWFSDNSEKLEINKSQNIRRGGKRVRGYTGLALKKEWM